MNEPPNTPPRGKRLLVATIGLATLVYGTVQGCDDDKQGEPARDSGLDAAADASPLGFDSGNLLLPPGLDAAADSAPLGFDSGNLLPPPPDASGKDATSDAAPDATSDAASDAALTDAMPAVAI